MPVFPSGLQVVSFIFVSPVPTRNRHMVGIHAMFTNWNRKGNFPLNQHGFGPKHPKHSYSDMFLLFWMAKANSKHPVNSVLRENRGERYFNLWSRDKSFLDLEF